MTMMQQDLLSSPLEDLLRRARDIRAQGFGTLQTWSPKVFIPLTMLCRDYCHYCTFSRPAKRDQSPYLTPEAVLAIARDGRAAGCSEALFTLGDKPELRHPAAREALAEMGYDTTVDYLVEMCRLVLDETGLLPHVNAGVTTREELLRLRAVSASMGLMLESTSDRLCQKGGPHYRSPDKMPSVRLEAIRLAGELAIPFTSGVLIGIGETREERLDALSALAGLHARYGHIQEIIVQNFRAKPGTPMASAAEPDMDELLWTIAAARIILGPDIAIQAPPNLSRDDFGRLLDAGVNDWGGVSPVTPDHVNPEAPWPDVEKLRDATERRGYQLAPRLPVYPRWTSERWIDRDVRSHVLAHMDATGLARRETWRPGARLAPPVQAPPTGAAPSARIADIVSRARTGADLTENDIAALFEARGEDVGHICAAADAMRRDLVGDTVTYVVNRNINYTNICMYRCTFCAFSKGSTHDELRGKPYDLDHGEIARRVSEARRLGATEVCMQGGIHPSYTGETYLSLLETVRDADPDIHIHAFSPLEATHGARTLGLSLRDYLVRLKQAGLGTLPGTAAEILDDEVRRVICPDKLTTDEWLTVLETAHDLGLQTTATIMFGHVETPVHWARHLIRIRDLQDRTGGITEFVPLPFVHMEAPMGLKGVSRHGPTFREVRLMHAVARLVFGERLPNIQASWPKLGPDGAKAMLDCGANDLGGVLMNESISRAAGASYGEMLFAHEIEDLVKSARRTPQQRSTRYGPVTETDRMRARNATAPTPVILTPPARKERNSVV